MWNREEWDEFCEHALVGVVLALVTVAVVAFGGMRASEFALVAGLAALALSLGITRLWLNGSNRLLLHPMVWPGLAFVGYATWRFTQVEVTYPGRHELLLLAVLAVVFLVALNNFFRQEPTQWVTHALVALGGAVGAYACIQWASGSTQVLWLPQPLSYARRAGGPFINPNQLAGFLTLLLPLALAQVFVGRGKPLAKVVYAYAALMMLGGIAVSMSRGGWGATGVGLLVLFAWLGWRRRELRIPVAVAVALLVAGGLVFLRTSEKARARVENVGKDGTIDAAGRERLWLPAITMWHDHAWLGVGPAQFDVVFPRYRTPAVQASPGWVHNEFLNLLTDYGLAGASLAGLTLGAFVFGVVRSGKYVERAPGDLGARASNRTAFFLGAWVGLLALAVHCFVDFDLHVTGVAVTATLVTALLASNLRFATERFWYRPGVVARLLLTAGALAGLSWMLPVAFHQGREGLVLNRIVRARQVTPTLLADLENAAREAPDNARTAYELGENLRRLSLQGEEAWQKHAQRAVEWLTRAGQLDPYDARIQLALGQTFNWLNQPEAAAAAFQRALDRGPNDALIHTTIAWYLLQQGRAAEAKQMAEESYRWQWWSNDLARDIAWQADQQLKRPLRQP